MRDSDAIGTFVDQMALEGVEGYSEIAVPGPNGPRRAALVFVKLDAPATWEQLRQAYADIPGAIYPVRCTFDRRLDEALFLFYKERGSAFQGPGETPAPAKEAPAGPVPVEPTRRFRVALKS